MKIERHNKSSLTTLIVIETYIDIIKKYWASMLHFFSRMKKHFLENNIFSFKTNAIADFRYITTFIKAQISHT